MVGCKGSGEVLRVFCRKGAAKSTGTQAEELVRKRYEDKGQGLIRMDKKETGGLERERHVELVLEIREHLATFERRTS